MAGYFFSSEEHELDVEVDLSSQVLELEVDEQESYSSLWGNPHRRRQRVIKGATGEDVEFEILDTTSPIEPYLHPTLPGIQRQWGWAPTMAFALKAKAFDDGLYAAVELLAQKGTPLLPGKRRIIEYVHQELLPHWRPDATDPLSSALLLLRTALSMTGTLEEPDRKLRLLVAKAIQAFESKPGESKPLGFYTWSPELQAVFKQDRLLQRELGADAARLLHEVLQKDATLLSAWRRHLRLVSRLTNPLSKPSLEEEGERRCFFPPSDSHEGRIVKELFPTQAPPEGFQLADELISRIRAGRLDTTPTGRSGWYDHQLHALVPFLMPEKMPEAERLILGPGYRAELEKQFRALFALTRETHIKQLEQLYAGGRPLIIAPRLSIEPLAEFYRRRAEGYLFVRHTLSELLGTQVLAGTSRVVPTGEVKESLLEELVGMEQLFRGAHAIIREELGFEAVPEALLPAVLHTRRWLRQWTEDPALAQDPRCVVPLFFDEARKKTKVTAVLGFHATTVEARFQRRPEVRLTDAQGRAVPSQRALYSSMKYTTVCPMTAEVYVSRVPDRSEFQALCAQHVGPQAILEALRG